MKHLLSLSAFLCFSLFNEVIEVKEHVFLYPPSVVAKYGHSVTLNCTTDVVNRTLFKFETSGNAFQINGTNWICLNMTIHQWDINPLCFVNFIGGQNRSKFIITVFDFPENIIFEPLHEMEVNKTYNLTCTVPNVGPVQNLTIKILKGNEELIVQDYPHDNQKKHQNMTVSHPFTPQISDHGRNLSCFAELNLSSVGEVHCTNSSMNLKVYAFPENVTLNVPKAVEVNQTTIVKCEISNVHPPEDLKVQLLLNGTELTTTRHTVGQSVLAEARFSIQGGEQYLKCNTTFRNMSIEKQEQVISYVLPEPVLHLPKVYAGYTANITCSVIVAKSEGVNITLKCNGKILPLQDGQHVFKAGKEDNGKNCTCETEVSVNGQIVTKTTHGIIKVKSIPVILICGLCGCIGILVIFVIIYCHLKKQNKLGRYNVLKAFLSMN